MSVHALICSMIEHWNVENSSDNSAARRDSQCVKESRLFNRVGKRNLGHSDDGVRMQLHAG